MTQQFLNRAQSIVLPDGTMDQIFSSWALLVSNNLPIIGSGSPEGIVEAAQYTLFIDEAVPLTPVEYRKMLPEIGGDRTKGWAALSLAAP
jgi:hypothetical protein